MNAEIAQKFDSAFLKKAEKVGIKEEVLALLNLVQTLIDENRSLQARVLELENEVRLLKGEKKSRGLRKKVLMEKSPSELLAH